LYEVGGTIGCDYEDVFIDCEVFAISATDIEADGAGCEVTEESLD
jgi:hypothetical protein